MNVVIVNCFDTYEQRVDLLYKIFTNLGYSVEVLTSDYKHIEKVQRTDIKNHFVFFHAKPYRKNISYSRLKSHVELSKNMFDYIEQHESPDLLWVLLPPNSFAKNAGLYKKTHPRVKLIFDLIDLWPETMPIGSIKNTFPFSIWKGLRDNNIRYADHIVTECTLYQEKLKNILIGMPITTLYLARPLIPYKPHINLPEDRINLCYLGSINNIIDIKTIGQIIQDIRKMEGVELHIIGDGERKKELIKIAAKYGAGVVFHGKIYDREEKQKIFDSCHYGLNIMKSSVCVGLTMKSMDYLEFGLPMINNIHGDTWDLIEEKGLGINIDENITPSELLKFLNQRKQVRDYFANNLTEVQFASTVKSILNSSL